MDPGVVRHPEPLRDHLGHVPPGAKLGVCVDPLQAAPRGARLPRVGARTRASAIAASGRTPRSPGPAAVSDPSTFTAAVSQVTQAERIESVPWLRSLSIERHDDVAVVTLRRPEKRNALSIELRVELADAFNGLSRDPQVGCVVLTGAGTAFCSGMDTSQFGGDLEHRKRLVETSTLAFEAVGDCRRPIVAAVNGPAIAGGFALALLCDLRIGSPRAVFGYPELPRGIPPSYAAARAVLPATIAQELCLTGRLVEAQEAQRLGIVREVADDVVDPRARARAANRRPAARGGARDEAANAARAAPPVGLPVRGRAGGLQASAAGPGGGGGRAGQLGSLEGDGAEQQGPDVGFPQRRCRRGPERQARP